MPFCRAGAAAWFVVLHTCKEVAFAQQQASCYDRPLCPSLMKLYSCTDTAVKMKLPKNVYKPTVELRDICCISCQAKSTGGTGGSEQKGKDDDVCKDQVDYCSSLKSYKCDKDTSSFKKGTTLQQICPSLCGCHKKPKKLNLVPGGNIACWGGKHTFKKCCDQSKTTKGDPECFSAKKGSEVSKFSFEVCCPIEGKEITCVDDPWFGNKYGDCTVYGPTVGKFTPRRSGKCVQDSKPGDSNSPLKRCPVSCGICQTKSVGNLKCWGAKYPFARCCGGRTGDSECFSAGFTYEKCCNLPAPPKQTKCEDTDMDPPCSQLVKDSKCDRDFSKIIKDLAKGTTLG
eukprot:COSAG05_NODE_745_length_7575_cov_3.254013_8_plen_342_part_00